MGKTILVILASAVLLVAAILIAPYFVSSSTGINWLKDNLFEKTGANVSAEKFRLRLLPYPSYSIEGLTVALPTEAGGQAYSLKAKKVSGEISLWQFLTGKVQASVKIDDASLNVTLSGDDKGTTALVAIAAATQPTDAFELTKLDIDNSRLYIMKEAQPVFIIENAQSAITPTPGQKGAVDIELAGTVINPFVAQSAVQSGKSSLYFKGQLVLDLVKKELNTNSFAYNFANSQGAISAKINFDSLPIKYNITNSTKGLNYQNASSIFSLLLSKPVYTPQWDGELSVESTFTNTTQEAPELTLNIEATNTRFAFGKWFIKAMSQPFRLGADMLFYPQNLTLKNIVASLAQETINMQGDVLLDGTGTFRLNISGTEISGSVSKTFFPQLGLLDALEHLVISASVEGALFNETPTKVSGSLKVGQLGALGFLISDVESLFDGSVDTANLTIQKGNLSFAPTAAAAAPAEVNRISGKATVKLGDTTALAFEGSVDPFDFASLPALGGFLPAKGNLSLKLSTDGTSPQDLITNLKTSGTATLTATDFGGRKLFSKVFSAETWNQIETLIGTKPIPAIIQKLENATQESASFTVQFDSLQGNLNLTNMTWKGKEYEASLKGTITAPNELRADGEIIFPKSIALGLISAPLAQKALFGKEAKFSIPIIAGGKFPEITILTDQAKLDNTIKPKFTPKVVATKEAAAAVPSEKPRAPEPTKTPTPAPAKEPEKSKTPEKIEHTKSQPSSQNTEDILKVIIGK